MAELKARVNSAIRVKTLVVIAAYAILFLFCLGMGIYDVLIDRILYGVLFIAVGLVFVALLLIKMNSAFGTYVQLKGGKLYMKSWENNFLPYDVNGSFMSDMIPAKTKMTAVPVNDISYVLVGTKDFVKKNATVAGKKLQRALYPYEHSKKKFKSGVLNHMELLYVETVDGSCAFMCVHDYDAERISKIIKTMYEMNKDISVKIGSSIYRKYLK